MLGSRKDSFFASDRKTQGIRSSSERIVSISKYLIEDQFYEVNFNNQIVVSQTKLNDSHFEVSNAHECA